MNHKIDTQIKDEADKARIKLFVDNLRHDEGPFRVTIDKDRENRSQKQNRIYRKWINIMADETGATTDAMARVLRERFLIMKLYDFDDLTKRSVDALRELKQDRDNVKYYRMLKEVLIDNVSTTQLNTKQFSEYLGEIQEWAVEKVGIILPVPDDLRTENLTLTQ